MSIEALLHSHEPGVTQHDNVRLLQMSRSAGSNVALLHVHKPGGTQHDGARFAS